MIKPKTALEFQLLGARKSTDQLHNWIRRFPTSRKADFDAESVYRGLVSGDTKTITTLCFYRDHPHYEFGLRCSHRLHVVTIARLYRGDRVAEEYILDPAANSLIDKLEAHCKDLGATEIGRNNPKYEELLAEIDRQTRLPLQQLEQRLDAEDEIRAERAIQGVDDWLELARTYRERQQQLESELLGQVAEIEKARALGIPAETPHIYT